MFEASQITPAILAKSVIAVPPLARRADFSLDRDGNRRVIEHLAQGGVTTALYGGNANLYNMAVSEFALLLDLLEAVSPPETWIIPSIGPDFGKCMDQIEVLRGRGFPTAMVLPLNFPATSAGVATGLRKLADAYGRPLIAYVKSPDYIAPADLGRVVADGAVCAIKYALVRQDPSQDPFLEELLRHVDRSYVVSGIGERPAIVHLNQFGLTGFTSGSVCVAPAMSAALLIALKAGNTAEAERLRLPYMELEDLRDGHSPLRVLHTAVKLAGIADTGPMMPFLSEHTDPALLADISKAARTLLAADMAYARERGH